MSGKFFIDTNIIVYSFDRDSPGKREKARSIVEEAVTTGNGVVSFQVVQEFLNVATRKFKKALQLDDARQFLEEILLPLCDLFPNNAFYRNALDIKERTGYSFYDAMILQAALEAQCRVLYSEDLQDGFKLFDLTIINPFS
jgi:predicted nucleic acid-binding protein